MTNVKAYSGSQAYPFAGAGRDTGTATFRFRAGAQTYAPPAGYRALGG